MEFINKSLILLILSLTAPQSAYAQQKPKMIWLKKPTPGKIDVQGTTITGGSYKTIMDIFASNLQEFDHEFKAYPMKRNWHLVKNSPKNTAYCYFGAAVKPERKEWGYYSKPSSISLPYTMAAPRGTLDKYETNGFVSIKELFEKGHKTLLFKEVHNMWVEVIKSYQNDYPHLIRDFVGNNHGMEEWTAKLLKAGRIDFGFVGLGAKRIEDMGKKVGLSMSMYQIKELIGKEKPFMNVLCSKNPSGKRMVDALDLVIEKLVNDGPEGRIFRDKYFEAAAHHKKFKPTFDAIWSRFYGIKDSPKGTFSSQ